MRKPTLEEVAAAAGVSKMTASRALRGAADVSRQSLARVRAAADALGYVGNQLALSLAARHTNLIGVVVPSMSNIVFPEVLDGISAGLEGTGKQAVFGISDYDPGKEREIIRNMLSWQPSAMIVTGLDQPEETLRLLRQADIPIVQIMDLDGTPVDFNVGLSHTGAGEDMGRALLATGRRKFAYIGSARGRDLRAGKRKTGFERALGEAGLRFVAEEVGEGASSSSLGKQLTMSLLTRGVDIDCIYYSNDDMAAGGLFACMEMNIPVPDRIMIAGFNGLELANALPVRIATSHSSRREIGETAARLACSALSNEREGLERTIRFTPEISLGDGARAAS